MLNPKGSGGSSKGGDGLTRVAVDMMPMAFSKGGPDAFDGSAFESGVKDMVKTASSENPVNGRVFGQVSDLMSQERQASVSGPEIG